MLKLTYYCLHFSLQIFKLKFSIQNKIYFVKFCFQTILITFVELNLKQIPEYFYHVVYSYILSNFKHFIFITIKESYNKYKNVSRNLKELSYSWLKTPMARVVIKLKKNLFFLEKNVRETNYPGEGLSSLTNVEHASPKYILCVI